MRRLTAGLLVLGVALLLARAVALETFRVEAGSMEPTLRPGDRVLVWRPGEVSRGDVVVVGLPGGGHAVKRVAALGGQVVGIDDGRLCVDGVCALEPWVDPRHVDGTFFGPVPVPDGHVFLLGDARDTSVDSRSSGPVPVDAVVGRVVLSR